ncbi:hypothetical protein ACIQVR_41790 [Streptomyces xanthochromogenes]|uniref:hypothetical protein n=1 Tax=Streptomyces xanthochromogenes TaxID=67384 RepID=UPI0038216EB5
MKYRRGSRTNHMSVAGLLREQPNVWLPVGEYPSRSSAAGIAQSIKSGVGLRAYQPAGAFEARTEMTEDGTTVLARYIGGPA